MSVCHIQGKALTLLIVHDDESRGSLQYVQNELLCIHKRWLSNVQMTSEHKRKHILQRGHQPHRAGHWGHVVQHVVQPAATTSWEIYFIKVLNFLFRLLIFIRVFKNRRSVVKKTAVFCKTKYTNHEKQACMSLSSVAAVDTNWNKYNFINNIFITIVINELPYINWPKLARAVWFDRHTRPVAAPSDVAVITAVWLNTPSEYGRTETGCTCRIKMKLKI